MRPSRPVGAVPSWPGLLIRPARRRSVPAEPAGLDPWDDPPPDHPKCGRVSSERSPKAPISHKRCLGQLHLEQVKGRSRLPLEPGVPLLGVPLKVGRPPSPTRAAPRPCRSWPRTNGGDSTRQHASFPQPEPARKPAGCSPSPPTRGAQGPMVRSDPGFREGTTRQGSSDKISSAACAEPVACHNRPASRRTGSGLLRTIWLRHSRSGCPSWSKPAAERSSQGKEVVSVQEAHVGASACRQAHLSCAADAAVGPSDDPDTRSQIAREERLCWRL